MTSEKLNPEAVERYADAYAEAVVQKFFQSKERISGKEIMTLTSFHQVNLFVIRELMHLWQHEIEKSRSPYFDYESKEVVQALAHYQNILSNHISISAQHFMPLLKKAVIRTMVLILDPYGFFGKLIEHQTISLKALKTEVKYIKINKTPLIALLESLTKESTETVTSEQADEQLVAIIKESHFVPEAIEPLIEKLSETEPLQVQDFFEDDDLESPIMLPNEPSPNSKTSNTSSYLENPPRSVADELAIKSTLLLKDRLSLNQKFMFTKILFHGDFEIFTDTIDKLDSCENLTEAMRYLDRQFPEWDRESEEYQELEYLIQKRLS